MKATRKLTTCDACLKHIPVGSPAERVVGLNVDGDFQASVMHPECKIAELELNKNYDLNADEWVCLHEFDREDEPWLLTEHPLAAARLGLTPTRDQP